jgi:hypothetical protein
MQLALEISADRRNRYLTKLSSIALDAALNSQQEIGIDEEEPIEYVKDLQNFGFALDEREVEVDCLLAKVRKTSPTDLKVLEHRLSDTLNKIIKFAEPQKDSALFNAYVAYVNADHLDMKVRHLLKVIGLYNTAYHENSDWSLDVNARLWIFLSHLQEIIDFFDPEDNSGNYVQTFLGWKDNSIEIENVASADSSYSMLNPNKLRYINSENGDLFFSKIAEEMMAQTENLKSFIEFNFISSENGSHVWLPDEEKFKTPFSIKDLQIIFEKMKFKATFKSSTHGSDNFFKFKVHF